MALAAQLVSDPGTWTLTGRRIGVYQVQALLGAGGMGEVYRARDTRLERHVALKILWPDTTTDMRDRARLIAIANHVGVGQALPSVVRHRAAG